MVKEIEIGNNLVKHFSDNGLFIKQVETGIEYLEASDLLPCKYTYIETQKPIIQKGIIEEEYNEILKEQEVFE